MRNPTFAAMVEKCDMSSGLKVVDLPIIRDFSVLTGRSLATFTSSADRSDSENSTIYPSLGGTFRIFSEIEPVKAK